VSRDGIGEDRGGAAPAVKLAMVKWEEVAPAACSTIDQMQQRTGTLHAWLRACMALSQIASNFTFQQKKAE
jgi:hypothetical protein